MKETKIDLELGQGDVSRLPWKGWQKEAEGEHESAFSRSRLRFQAMKKGGDRHLTQSHVECYTGKEKASVNVKRVVVKEDPSTVL